jgi:hypothetical protein
MKPEGAASEAVGAGTERWLRWLSSSCTWEKKGTFVETMERREVGGRSLASCNALQLRRRVSDQNLLLL